MKFLFVFVAALAVASAGHIVAPVYPGAQHLPVIGPNGVPVDTPAVQHAAASHLAHKVEAHARNGDFHPDYHHQFAAGAPIAAPIAAHYPVHHPAAGAAYPTSFGVPAVTGAGVPLETPEVVAAKSAHFAAHGEALARTGHAAGYHYVAKRGIYTPLAYTTPTFAYGAYGHHYLAKRGIYTPSIYGHYGYTHGAYPYAHYY